MTDTRLIGRDKQSTPNTIDKSVTHLFNQFITPRLWVQDKSNGLMMNSYSHKWEMQVGELLRIRLCLVNHQDQCRGSIMMHGKHSFLKSIILKGWVSRKSWKSFKHALRQQYYKYNLFDWWYTFFLGDWNQAHAKQDTPKEKSSSWIHWNSSVFRIFDWIYGQNRELD